MVEKGGKNKGAHTKRTERGNKGIVKKIKSSGDDDCCVLWRGRGRKNFPRKKKTQGMKEFP